MFYIPPRTQQAKEWDKFTMKEEENELLQWRKYKNAFKKKPRAPTFTIVRGRLQRKLKANRTRAEAEGQSSPEGRTDCLPCGSPSFPSPINLCLEVGACAVHHWIQIISGQLTDGRLGEYQNKFPFQSPPTPHT